MIFVLKVVLLMLTYRRFSTSFRILRGFNHIQPFRQVVKTYEQHRLLSARLLSSVTSDSSNIDKTTTKKEKKKVYPKHYNVLIDCLKSRNATAAIEILKTFNVSDDKENI